MRLRRWYWVVLGIWVFTGLPIYLLSRGMFGESILDIVGFVGSLRVPTSSWDAFITWFIPTLLVLLPLLAMPLAITRRQSRLPDQ